jgi:hypothetical protein
LTTAASTTDNTTSCLLAIPQIMSVILSMNPMHRQKSYINNVLDEIAICLALHSPEVRASAISFVNFYQGWRCCHLEAGIVCFTYYMSFASGCECSIPQNVNSPSIKFTRKVLHKIRKESDLLANATTRIQIA